MNLKRGFLALAAMILGVGFFGASQAHAACPPTAVLRLTPPTTTWNTWPDNSHMWYCGPLSPTTDGGGTNDVRQRAVSASDSMNSQPVGQQPKLRFLFTFGVNGSGAVNVYKFDDWNTAKTFFGINPPLPVQGTPLGYTTGVTESASHPGINVIVLNQLTAQGAVDHTKIGRITNHEMGHAVDRVYGGSAGALPSLNPNSNYNINLTVDRNNFNALTESQAFSAYGGVPGNCWPGDLTKSNWQKLQCKWPSLAGNDSEFFASVFGAIVPGGLTEPQLTNLINQKFTNTRDYMQNLRSVVTQSP